MPELPEVETVMRGMDQAIRGLTIKSVKLHREGLRVPFPAGLAKKLAGQHIIECRRRAKYIVVELSGPNVLVIHLGMSGQIFLVAPGHPFKVRKHDHLVITFDNGARLAFNDARRFGMALLIPRAELGMHPAFANLGPEPLSRGFTGSVLANILKGRRVDLKAALMDQRNVAGLGNIYVAEALFYAGLHPQRLAATVQPAEATRLVKAIKKVLHASIKAGGSTLKDYRHADGELGYFQHQFAVYGQTGKACVGCICDPTRTGGIQKITQAGRSTFFCPRKQE